MLVFRKEVIHKVPQQFAANSSFVTVTTPTTIGGDITPTQDCRLRGIGWSRGIENSVFGRVVGLWSPGGNLMATTVIGSIGSVSPFTSPVPLKQGITYTIGVYLLANDVISDVRPVTAIGQVLQYGEGKFTLGNSLARPITDSGNGWSGDFLFDVEYSTYEEKIEPPEPSVTTGARQFSITLPAAWLPSTSKEWDLQYSKSRDSTVFGHWIDVGTFPVVETPDADTLDAELPAPLTDSDSDLAPDQSGNYVHNAPDTVSPTPYYRYRYRIRTDAAESVWSETAYAGRVRLSVQGGDIEGAVPEANLANNVGPGGVGPGAILPGVITAMEIRAGAITTIALAANSITAGNIQAGAIQAGHIAAQAVVAGNIAAGAVMAGTIAAGAVTADALSANAVTAEKLAANAVTAGKIDANAITATTIAAGAVTAGKLSADAVQAGNIAVDVVTAREIAAGSITTSELAANSITAGKIQAGAIQAGKLASDAVVAGNIAAGAINAANLIVDGLINGVKIADGAINGVKLADGAVTAGKVSAAAIQAGNLDVNAVTAGTIAAGAINSPQILADGIIVSGKLAAGSISANNLFVDGVINGTKIQDGTINGVKMMDGTIEAVKITAGTITSRQVAADLLDANLSQAAYLDASAISGGNLVLGGTRTYSNNFNSSSGDLLNPWQLTGTGKAFAQYAHGPVPVTKRYDVSWSQALRIDLVPGEIIPAGEMLTFLYAKPTNRVTKFRFHVKQSLPTVPTAALRSELVDNNGNLRPTIPWAQTGVYETAGGAQGTELFDVQADGLTGGVGISLRNNSGSPFTVPAGTWYIELSVANFEYEKGYGTLSIFDAQNRLRSEMTSEYISMRKVIDATTTQEVFRADSNGIWVPQDGLTIGSTRISNLEYSQRDLSGGLMINPRFENLRTIDPSKILPSDWTFLPDEARFGYREGTLPQIQSLVSGRTLTMTLPAGWTPASSRTVAVSHKRYVQADQTMSTAPITMSAYFKCPPADPDIQVKMTVYASTSAADITGIADLSNDTKLGEAILDGSVMGATTVDGQILFQRVGRSFSQATGAIGDTMSVSTAQGAYVYVTLEVYVKAGRPALSSARTVDWDNVDLALAESPTPSDNQSIADLARRLTDLQTLIQYMQSGTKAVLGELGTGVQGLDMVAVY